MARYCDKKGIAIGEAKWRELQDDYEYTFLREYENDKLLVECVWTGRVDAKAHEMFWEPFSVIIWHRFNDKWVEEPETHAFGDEYEALAFYDKYLFENTDCFFGDGGGELIEVDNLATERRHKAIALKREQQAEKDRLAQERADAKQAHLDKIAKEKARIEKEKADDIRMLAELEEIQRISNRGDSYGGW